MSAFCEECGAMAGYGYELGHRVGCSKVKGAPTELLKKACQFLKEHPLIQTPITTKNGEIVVLYHAEPLSTKEKEALQDFTSDELKLLMKIQNMKEYKL